MTTYEISFEFDFDKIEDEISNSDELDIDIEYIDVDSFIEDFQTSQGIKEFEDWYNSDYDNEEDKISIKDVDYYSDDKKGYIAITLEKEIKNPNIFALEVLDYVYDQDQPIAEVHYSGSYWEMGWNDIRQEPSEYKRSIDSSETISIDNYKNVKIRQIS